MAIALKHAADSPAPNVAHPTYITTTHGLSGHFAVMVWWNPEGFWEPWNTAAGRYETRAEAEADAKEWAQAEGLEYRP